MENLTLLVSVDDYSLNQAKERDFYACPASYGRNRGQYVAFYQKQPVSAITHYGKVEEIFEDQGDFLTGKDKFMMLPNESNNKATVFKLEKVYELETPVKNDIPGGVQGAWYQDLQEIQDADNISELKNDK